MKKVIAVVVLVGMAAVGWYYWRQRDVTTAHIDTTIQEPFVQYAKLAESLGQVGIGPITDPKELGAAVKRGIEAVKMGEPVLIDVVCQPR